MPVGRTIVTGIPRSPAGVARQLFAFELRLLVHVAGLQGRVFVRRRMLHVAVHADRAAMHDALHARSRRSFDDGAGRDGVHLTVGFLREARLPV